MCVYMLLFFMISAHIVTTHVKKTVYQQLTLKKQYIKNGIQFKKKKKLQLTLTKKK